MKKLSIILLSILMLCGCSDTDNIKNKVWEHYKDQYALSGANNFSMEVIGNYNGVNVYMIKFYNIYESNGFRRIRYTYTAYIDENMNEYIM